MQDPLGARRRAYLYKVMRLFRAQTELFEPVTFAEMLTHVLDPHREINKYARRWRMARPQTTGRFIHGKLGFVSSSEVDTLVFDERELDFVTEPIPKDAGQVALFSVSLDSQVLAFEAVPGHITRGTFVGRFTDFIEAAGAPLELNAITAEGRFERWRATVDRVLVLDVSVTRPNPDVTEATVRTSNRLKDLQASLIKEHVESDLPDGINTNARELSDAIEHTSAGYGRTRARAVRGDREVEFDSKSTARTRLFTAELDDPAATHNALDAVIEEAEDDETRTG